ncbi:TPA: hypothetical protein QEL19_001252 [Stenotrophomonas maltophilia]|nr:hypothetical protein [Stenotrophomonas maltophilia]
MTQLDHVTQDISQLQHYRGLGSSCEIVFNACPDKFVVTGTISPIEWRDVGVEVERSIVLKLTSSMTEFREDRNVIRAFDFKASEDGTPGTLHYLRQTWLLRAIGDQLELKSGQSLSQALALLSKDDQIRLWRRIQPEDLAGVRVAFQEGRIKKVDLRLSTVFSCEDPLAMVDQLISLLSLPAARGQKYSGIRKELIAGSSFKKIVHLILTTLWRRGHIFYSLAMTESLVAEAKAETGLTIRSGSLVQVLQDPDLFPNELFRRVCTLEIKALGKRADATQNLYLSWFLLSTNCSDIGDISPELLTATRDFKLASYKWWELLRVSFESVHGSASFPVPPRSRVFGEVRTRSLEWVLREDARLSIWTELYERMFASEYKTYTPQQYTDARHFFRWLMTLESWPSPQALDHKQVRNDGQDRDGSSFREYLDNYATKTTRQKPGPLRAASKTGAMRQLYRVMDFNRQENLSAIALDQRLIGSLRVDNPVAEGDWIWKQAAPRRTHRSAVGTDVLEFCRELLLDRDGSGVPTFGWPQSQSSLRRDWIVVDGAHSGKWPYERSLPGGRIEIWQPTRALAIYLMLELPLRGFQVRWLDSGLGDEYVWDMRAARLVENDSALAEISRSFGVFRPLTNDVLSGNDQIGIYVTTNKTQMWNPEDFRGFTIPWPDAEIYSILDIQREWCKVAATIFHTEKLRLSDDDLNIKANVVDILPGFHVLFRDASSFAGGNRPVSSAKMEALWVLLCGEAQVEWSRRGTPLRLLTQRSGGRADAKRAIHDLHSLRVSGITSLYLKGVPVEIISKYIAGHASIAMTLHYEASDPREIRRRLHAYQHRSESNSGRDDARQLMERLESGESLSPELLKEVFGQDAFTRLLMSNDFLTESQVGIEAAKHVSGSWVWYGDGICPGAKCSEGDELGGPVKGGARSCGNCKFFLTGTAFLYGQAHRCNELMYDLRRLGLERENCYAMKRQAAVGSKAYVNAQARIEEIDAHIEPKLSDWWARYQLLQKSIAATERIAPQGGAQALTSDAPREDFQVSATVTNHVQLLKELSQSSDILNAGQENMGPVLELNSIINVVLSKCGIDPFLLGVPDSVGRATTTVVAEAMQNLFRMHYNCTDTDAYRRIQNVYESVDAMVDPVLAASLASVADAFKPMLQAGASSAVTWDEDVGGRLLGKKAHD